jgi:histidyl-tRNA synthetase
MVTLSSQPYKGTRDYYPEQKRVQNYIFNTWRSVVEGFGYEEYGAPILEPLEIYAAKSGNELVNDQTYVFTDRGDRTVAIRPEMTPSISRMVAARRQELAYPARLYSIANFMRYERPQRGREREFWQLNVDLFGVDDITADVEVITIADSILKAFGAGQDDYVIRVNNRKFIHFMMARYLGLDIVAAGQMTKLFDRRGKITEQDFEEQVTLILGDEAVEQIPKIKQVIDAKTIDELPAELQASPSLDEIKAVFVGLKKQNVTNAVFDATLMRGLDYYTGTVFEAFDTHPDNNRSLFGGGRYDGLVGLFGAEPLSAVGMAPGNTMIENFLTVHNLLPEDQSLTQVYVVVIGTALDGALEVATKLRKAGIKTEVDITSRKLDKQMKTALKKLIPNILFIGESEVEMGEYTLKNLASETEEKLTVQQILDKFA